MCDAYENVSTCTSCSKKECLDDACIRPLGAAVARAVHTFDLREGPGQAGSKIGKLLANFCKFLAGSFSAVSKRNLARKYAFDSIFQALQDLHPFAPLQSQNFRKKSV